MDLAIATGYGPDILTNLDGLRPLVREQDVVLFGYRDAELAKQEGSQDVRTTKIETYDLNTVRRVGIKPRVSSPPRHL
jgi:arginase